MGKQQIWSDVCLEEVDKGEGILVVRRVATVFENSTGAGQGDVLVACERIASEELETTIDDIIQV